MKLTFNPCFFVQAHEALGEAWTTCCVWSNRSALPSAPFASYIHAGVGKIHLHKNIPFRDDWRKNTYMSCFVSWKTMFHWFNALWGHGFASPKSILVYPQMFTSKRLNQAPPSPMSSLHFNKNNHGKHFAIFPCTTCFSRFLRNLVIALKKTIFGYRLYRL